MIEKDVIISAFSCGGKMKCTKQAETFKEPPALINVPGGSLEGFKQTSKQYLKNGSILDSLLASKMNKIRPRRICLISFSDGWSWISNILKLEKDINRIDTIIILNGIYSNSLNHWKNFAIKASNKKTNLWLIHNKCKLEKGTAPKTTNNKLFNLIKRSKQNIIIPDSILNASLEKIPTSIYSKEESPKHKLYQADTLEKTQVAGNLVNLGYSGDRKQDQIYLQQYVQPRLWYWLRDIWADPTVGTFFI